MADKIEEVMQQYDLQVISSFRGRGAIICQTDKGIFKAEPFQTSIRRLYREYALKEALYEEGFIRIDRYLMNKEDALITYDRYHTPFLIKHYFRGRECDLLRENDLLQAVNNLAKLHITMQKLNYGQIMNYGREELYLINEENCSMAEEEREREEEQKDIVELRNVPEEPDNSPKEMGERKIDFMERHNKEMSRVCKYVKKMNHKTEFELLYLARFPYFYAQAVKMEEEYEKLLRRKNQQSRFGLCHGAYHQHNVLICEDGIATINFNHFSYDHQLLDLYQIMRKTLEKNHFSFSVFQKMADEYAKTIPLSKEDYDFLYILFAYPEKFWKISNHYMNRRKSWIPPKMKDKLDTIWNQEAEKNIFLNRFRMKYDIPF